MGSIGNVVLRITGVTLWSSGMGETRGEGVGKAALGEGVLRRVVVKGEPCRCRQGYETTLIVG